MARELADGGAGSPRGPPEGAIVELHGLRERVDLLPLGAEDAELLDLPDPRDFNGRLGRCAAWDEERRRRVVETFAGPALLVAAEHLRERAQPAAAEGGFDALWPAEPAGAEEAAGFAAAVCQAVAARGYCVVQMRLGAGAAREAARAARAAGGPEALPEEAERAWLGRENPSSVRTLEHDGPDRVPGDALQACDRHLTLISLWLRPLTPGLLGFENWGRTASLVRLARDGHEAEPMSAQDVEGGGVERLISFVRLRRLSLLYEIESGGGRVDLVPREGAALAGAAVPLLRSRLLLFNHELLDYAYRPVGPSVALQTWLMQPPLRLEVTGVAGDGAARETVSGLSGPPRPSGEAVHVVSTRAQLPRSPHVAHGSWLAYLGGAETQSEVPLDRWDLAVYYSADGPDPSAGKTNARHGAFLETALLEAFDNAFFGLSAAEAGLVAPEQRLVADVGCGCLAEAGLSRQALRGRDLMVFTGDCAGEFSSRCASPGGQRFVGAASAATAARLSHALGLTGPTCAFDTACSSSLTAAGYAHSMLRRGAGRAGRAGALTLGVRVMLGADAFVSLGAGGFLGPDGRCMTFDAHASGFGRGEGCAAVLLRAEEDDALLARHLACLVGTCVNQDGRSASMTAPHGPSQQECIRDSLAVAGISPDSVSLAECHGTGTALGDPIEVGAIRGVLHGRDALPLLLTSAKSNVGHGESAAGATGVVRCVLVLLHSVAPPNVHLQALNPHLDVEGFPCYLETEATDSGRSCHHVGVSSFGFGGTNARADLWGCCRAGPRAAGLRAVDLDACEYLSVPCPVCLGPMCWLCGVAVPGRAASGARHRCALVRGDGEAYDRCSGCSAGSYLVGAPPVDEAYYGVQRVCIVGTWSAWRTVHEMELQEPGHWACSVLLGETLCESFRLLADGDPGRELYPLTDGAGAAARVEGPDGGARGRSWLIDARQAKKPPGTAWRVSLRWGPEGGRRVGWEATDARGAGDLDSRSFGHEYFVLGSWRAWAPLRMAPLPGAAGAYEARFRLGSSGEEEFRFARDADRGQAIHPAAPRAEEESVPVRGPDGAGGGLAWLARGQPGQEVRALLRVREGHLTVQLRPGTPLERTWESGRELVAYFLTGPFNRWGFAPMTPERGFGIAGIHRCRLVVGAAGREEFHLVVDEDPARQLYPLQAGAGPGEGLLVGPDAARDGRHWLLRGDPGTTFEVVLDTNQEDRRRMLNWRRVAADSAADSTISRTPGLHTSQPVPQKVKSDGGARFLVRRLMCASMHSHIRRVCLLSRS